VWSVQIEHATGTKNSDHLADGATRVGDVLEGRVAVNQIERPGWHREFLSGGAEDSPRRSQGRDRHRLPRRIHAPRVSAAVQSGLVESAGAAADVEEPRARNPPPGGTLEPDEPFSLIRRVVEAYRHQVAPTRDTTDVALVTP